MGFVTLEKREHIGILTISRPEALNALNSQVLADLDETITQVEQDSEIYVAANVNTASASEALIGAMISYGTIGYEDIFITDTVGQGSARTYGKGIMQTTYYNVATGEAAKLTTAQIYWPNGESIHGSGITTAMGARPSPAKSFGEYGDPELTAILAAIASEGGADTLSLL